MDLYAAGQIPCAFPVVGECDVELRVGTLGSTQRHTALACGAKDKHIGCVHATSCTSTWTENSKHPEEQEQKYAILPILEILFAAV